MHCDSQNKFENASIFCRSIINHLHGVFDLNGNFFLGSIYGRHQNNDRMQLWLEENKLVEHFFEESQQTEIFWKKYCCTYSWLSNSYPDKFILGMASEWIPLKNYHKLTTCICVFRSKPKKELCWNRLSDRNESFRLSFAIRPQMSIWKFEAKWDVLMIVSTIHCLILSHRAPIQWWVTSSIHS